MFRAQQLNVAIPRFLPSPVESLQHKCRGRMWKFTTKVVITLPIAYFSMRCAPRRDLSTNRSERCESTIIGQHVLHPTMITIEVDTPRAYWIETVALHNFWNLHGTAVQLFLPAPRQQGTVSGRASTRAETGCQCVARSALDQPSPYEMMSDLCGMLG